MWATFFAAVLVCVVALYLPGFLLFKALRFSGVVSVAAAPIASVALIAGLPIAYKMAHVGCSVLTVGGGALATGSRLRGRM